jgi:hypothetical protein
LACGRWTGRTFSPACCCSASSIIAPFVISVILLTFREVILGARSKRLRQAQAALGLDAAPAREAAYVRRERGDTHA